MRITFLIFIRNIFVGFLFMHIFVIEHISHSSYFIFHPLEWIVVLRYHLVFMQLIKCIFRIKKLKLTHNLLYSFNLYVFFVIILVISTFLNLITSVSCVCTLLSQMISLLFIYTYITVIYQFSSENKHNRR